MNKRFAKSAYLNFLMWSILSSLGMTISTIIDAFLVGNIIGSDGLAVANIATPVFLAYALIGVTLGVGANVNIGRLLGASNLNEANRAFRSLLTVGLICGLLALIPVVAFHDSYLRLLGVNDLLFPIADQYLTVVMYSAPVFILYHILSISVRTDSDPKLAAVASVFVIITNLSLDLLFMGVLGWGIVGASASLCIAEGMGCIVLLFHFLKKRSLLKIRLAIPKFKEIREFIANGFGVGSAYIFQAVVMLSFNTILLRFDQLNGVLYVAIFGVIYTVSMIPFAVFDGASNALSTVASFFAGELDLENILTVLRQAVKAAVSLGIVLAVGCSLFSEELAMFFGLGDENSIVIAGKAIKYFSISIIFTGINTVVTAFWQSIGRAKLAAGMSIIRNFVLMLILGLVLIKNFQIIGLSFTYVGAEFLCSIAILVILLVRSSRDYVLQRYTFNGRFFENNYIIQTQSVEQISSDFEKVFEEWEIAPKQTFLINLIVEELLLNIIKFGLHDKKKEHYIAIKLMEMEEGEYVIRIRDNVNTYNPFESSGDDIDTGVMKLITQKSKFYKYERKMIFNYLYLRV